MTLVFDKRQLIVSPALAPLLREADEFGRQQDAHAVLTIGLINNMPDSALHATERQFMRLLKAAAGNNRIHLHYFSLPSVHRSQTAKCRIDRQYTDIAHLGRLQLDGLIVPQRLRKSLSGRISSRSSTGPKRTRVRRSGHALPRTPRFCISTASSGSDSKQSARASTTVTKWWTAG
jgi:hypothetical protein